MNDLTLVIPAKNEADNLEDILNYFDGNLQNTEFELLLINDFSDDLSFSASSEGVCAIYIVTFYFRLSVKMLVHLHGISCSASAVY